LVDGQIKTVDEPALTALNMRLRDDYVKDCQGGANRWNKIIEKAGIKFQITLPSVAFHRHIGEFMNVRASPDGKLLTEAESVETMDRSLPSKADGDFIASLMTPCWERGKYAGWIAPPKVGVDNKSGDFEYVRIHQA
jgi:benzoyl-CoA 2,3-dioxygenase component B